MPSMRLFKRRWAVGSDDFVFPALTEAMLRLVWLFFSICLVAIQSPVTCLSKVSVDTYMAVTMLHNVLVMCHCVYIAMISSRGTIYNAVPRRKMATLLYIRCALYAVDVLLAFAGCLVVSKATGSTGCSSVYLVFINLYVVLAWMMVVIVLVEVWMVFDPLGRHSPDDLRASTIGPKMWHSRLRRIFCCFSRNERSRVAFEDAAEMFSQLFDDTDLVFTDIWAGLLLLADQRNCMLRSRSRDRSTETVCPEWMNMKAAERYMHFAKAVYGWPYYLLHSGCSLRPLWTLLRRLRFCYHCRCDHVLVIRDNCCLCNTVSFMLQTGLAESDLFYVNYRNEIWETPFIACVDHSTSSIVIAIRGSLSLRDAFTDLCVTEASVDVQIDSTADPTAVTHKAFVHRGILKSAKYVHDKLIAENIIDDLFVLHPNYGLVVVGHSLGAGVAAILSLLLRPTFPMVHCFAFSPPGCVVDDTTNNYLRQFVCTITVGDDLVSRMSYHSMMELKEMVRTALEQCNRAKYELLVRGCFRWLFANRTSDRYQTLDQEVGVCSSPAAPPLTEPNQSVSSGSSERLICYPPKATYNTGATGPHARPRLSCPGRIFHVYPCVSQIGRRQTFDVRICDANDLREILLTNNMVVDHMPQTVQRALGELSLVKHY